MASTDWTAMCNHMGPDPTLTVEGTVMLPSPGYTNVGLHRAENPGVNPDDLRLEVHATPPTDRQPQRMTPYPVSYEEKPPSREYDTVSIVESGPTGIKVNHVQ